MNTVEEGAVAGVVGAEPAGGRNDHGQLSPRWAQQVLARRGVCRSGVHLAGARAPAEPVLARRRNPRPAGAQQCPAPAEFLAVEHGEYYRISRRRRPASVVPDEPVARLTASQHLLNDLEHRMIPGVGQLREARTYKAPGDLAVSGVVFTIRLHHRSVCPEPTGETRSQAGATPFDE